MQQALAHDTLAITTTDEWWSCERIAEEFWETPLPRTRLPIGIIPEKEVPY